MSNLITVTEASRSFSDIIGRVHYKGEEFEIKKGTSVVARLVPSKQKKSLPISELNSFFVRAPKLLEEDTRNFLKDIKEMKLFPGNSINKWD